MSFVPYVGPRIIPNTVDVIVHWQSFGNNCENVFQMKYSTIPTSTTLNALAAEFGGAWLDVVRAAQPASVNYVDVVCKDIGAAGRQQGQFIYPPGTNGQNTGGPEPLNVAVSALLKTAKVGRRFKGRKSLSGFAENDVTGNTLGVNIMSLVTRVALALLRSYLSGAFLPAVGSLPNMATDTHPFYPAESNVITSVTPVDTNADSQKTRLNGRGR